jgi:stage II sporulation protein M
MVRKRMIERESLVKQNLFRSKEMIISLKIVVILLVLSFIFGFIIYIFNIPFTNTLLLSFILLLLITTVMSYRYKINGTLFNLSQKIKISLISSLLILLIYIIYSIRNILNTSYDVLIYIFFIYISLFVITFILIYVSLDFFHKPNRVFNINKNKSNKIYLNFLKSWNYLKIARSYVFIAGILILFTAMFAFSGDISRISPALEKSIDSYVTNSVQEIVRETSGLGPFQLIGFIMSNNIKTAFFGFISGIYFAISPIIIIIFNGYVLGFVAEKAVTSPVNTEGIFVLWRLLPHGIFEIPAILISIGLGIKLGLYPFFVREKGKGFLSLLIAFVIFLILSSIIMFVLLAFSGAGISSNSISNAENSLSNLLHNPAFSFAFFILMALSYVVSIVIGLKVLSYKDKDIVKGILADSIRVFVFVIVPLLVIAGIIEGLLIALVG